MNEVSQAINGYTKPLERLLDCIKGKDTPEKLLDVVAICKQVEELTSTISASCIPKANAEYLALVSARPGLNSWDILDGNASVSKYSPKCTWKYPEEIVKTQTELKAAMKDAQETGKAKKTTPVPDPNRSACYAVTLMAMPISAPKAKKD